MNRKPQKVGDGLSLKIAVCEDETSERDALRNMLETEIGLRRIEAEISTFASGEDMLIAMRDEIYPISFLDIYMGTVTGIEVAKEIRSRDENAVIVFTTISREHMAEGYDVGAVHYLVKPYSKESVRIALDRCLRVTGTRERFIEVMAGGEKRKLFLSKILWAESLDKKCVICFQAEEKAPPEHLRVYMRLDELLSIIDDPSFLRSHRSFIVNLDHAASVFPFTLYSMIA